VINMQQVYKDGIFGGALGSTDRLQAFRTGVLGDDRLRAFRTGVLGQDEEAPAAEPETDLTKLLPYAAVGVAGLLLWMNRKRVKRALGMKPNRSRRRTRRRRRRR
jgi:hypothetical protein